MKWLAGTLLLLAAACNTATGGRETVLCVGDSITAGVENANGYPTYLRGGAWDVVVAARKHLPTLYIERELAEALEIRSADYVVICAGANDAQLLPPRMCVESLTRMVAMARSSGATPIVITLPPWARLFPGGREIDAAIRQLDAVIVEMPQEPELYLRDQLHPNDAGARKLAELVAAKMAE